MISEKADSPIRLEPVDAAPVGMESLADDDPKRFWILSDGASWKLALGQNMRDFPPEVFVAKSGTIFVGLYHGTAAAVASDGGKILARGNIFLGDCGVWHSYS